MRCFCPQPPDLLRSVKEDMHIFDALDFPAELTQHIPPKRLQLIRRHGLYASRTKGRWDQMPYVAERAPEG